MLFLLNQETLNTHKVCGLDEAGRGPLAGPVSAACVVLNPKKAILGLADSKKLSIKKREQLFLKIQEQALAWGHAFIWPEEIERLNIHYASLFAMQVAFRNAKDSFPEPIAELELALADGKFTPNLKEEGFLGEVKAIISGDSLVECISAASIVAKVLRDRYMCDYAKEDPRYGFEKHMGYATALHREAIKMHGPCQIHRLSWLEPKDRASFE